MRATAPGSERTPVSRRCAATISSIGPASCTVERDEADSRQHLARRLARRGPEDENPALARLAQTDRELQQRRLAGAVRADERRDRAGRNRKRAVAERPERVVPLAERARLERGEAHAASSKNASRNPAAMSA